MFDEYICWIVPIKWNNALFDSCLCSKLFFYTLGGLKATIVHGCVYEARIIYGICFISS